MTQGQVLDLAVLTFKERDLRQPSDANHFFHEYGVGNTTEGPNSPYERFTYYRELLARLRASDPTKFAAIHKGTPLYFLSWLAFDLHQFEGALHFLDAAILDLVACMECCAIREAALRMQTWWLVGEHRQLVSKGMRVNGRVEQEMSKLPFSLRLNGWHPYLDQRGISRQTADTFGVGYYAGRGFLCGRIVFPIHNERGGLVAYAGRRLDGVGPKYLFPAGFSKSRTLFHLQDAVRFAPPTGKVILVEGFFDCMKVHQAGFGNVVALMGTNLSDHQVQLLAERFRRVVLMLDGDEAGKRAGPLVAARLSGRLSVDVIALSDRIQPDQMSSCEIQHLLQPAMGSLQETCIDEIEVW